MVVDQGKFKEMFKNESESAAIKKTSGLLKQTETVIDSLKDNFEKEFQSLLDIVQVTVQQESVTSYDEIKKIFQNHTNDDDRLAEIDKILQKQNLLVTSQIARKMTEKTDT